MNYTDLKIEQAKYLAAAQAAIAMRNWRQAIAHLERIARLDLLLAREKDRKDD